MYDFCWGKLEMDVFDGACVGCVDNNGYVVFFGVFVRGG